MTQDEPETGDVEVPVYVYRPSAFGAPRHFQLLERGIAWDLGRRSGQLSYDRITRVRLSYRPATLQAYRFITEIWSPDAPRLTVISASWKSMVEQVDLCDDYRAFVIDLHRHLAAAGTRARFDAGIYPLLYWPGLAAFVAAAIGFVGLIIRAISEGAGLAGLLIFAFLLLFLWQAGNIFYRNRPSRYRPDALPPLLVPRAKR
jgi:hypothetical protein